MVFAGWMLNSGNAERAELRSASSLAVHTAGVHPRRVSIEPLPQMDGEMCLWVPARSNRLLKAALQEERLAPGARAESSSSAAPSVEFDRAPVRVLRDTYPTYSAVAVDTNSNEVYLQDENLFGYKVFDRLENTPPRAGFSEPKRMVGGNGDGRDATQMNFNCGLYVDPKTGDVYSVNNDTGNTLVVFPREARGIVPPQRALKTPHGTFGIAVDENAQELFLTVQHTNEVVVYRKYAEGREKPLRTLAGHQARLQDPHGIALDTKNNLLFVSNHGSYRNTEPPIAGSLEPASITVYPLKAEGNTAPPRIIQGPKTQLNWPAAMYLDEERGELYVANDAGDSILVFRGTDSGNVAPLRVVKGPQTGIKNPTGVYVDLKNQELWVSNMGNHSATVYPRAAQGDVAPLRTIRSAPLGKLAQAIGNPGAVAYDSTRDEILVPN